MTEKIKNKINSYVLMRFKQDIPNQGCSLQKKLDIAQEVLERFLNALFVDHKSNVFWFNKEHKAQLVSVRMKETKSIVDKVYKKVKIKEDENNLSKPDYKQVFNSLTDLVGGRVVFTTSADAKKAGEFINLHFHVDEFNSGDKAEMKKNTEFGYLSIHYIINLKGDFFENKDHRIALKYSDKDIKKYASLFNESPLRMEIQVRSLLQHAWAEVAHNTIYKNKDEDIIVPPESKRNLNAIAAILENADNDINSFMYMFNEQKGNNTNKYMEIAKILSKKTMRKTDQWDKYSLKSLLFEINGFLRFHPDDTWSMTVKLLAKILLWDNNVNVDFSIPASMRSIENKRNIFRLKNRRDDILNTLMHIIRLQNKTALRLIRSFKPFEADDTEGLLLIDTIRLAIDLSNSTASSDPDRDKKYIMWASDTRSAEESVKKTLRDMIKVIDLSGVTSLAMIYPSGRNDYFDDSEQFARLLTHIGKRKCGNICFFCHRISYKGKETDWTKAYPFIKTENSSYSLYEPLYVLKKSGINPKNLMVIGYNLQRTENMLCRFALAAGAKVLICKHRDMNRFRSTLQDSEWDNMNSLKALELSNPKKDAGFIKNYIKQ